MRTTLNVIDNLKVDGMYFAAGALAFSLGCECNYGCHFGMRSTRDVDAAEFKRGWHAARDGRASQGGK